MVKKCIVVPISTLYRKARLAKLGGGGVCSQKSIVSWLQGLIRTW